MLKAAAAAGVLPLPFIARAIAMQTPPELPGVDFMTASAPRNGPDFQGYNAETFAVPRLRALCRSSQGVANAVKWAADTQTPFAIRSTGHDFAGHSQHDGLVIDTSPLNAIGISGDGERLTVGAGSRNGAISIALAGAGRILGSGTFESVGAAGITLGGGIGHFSRLTGLACDQLESVELVDSNGDIRSVSEDADPDLFWALRGGGGGSLGVVTALTYRTTAAPRLTRVDAPIAVAAVDGARILHEWQHWLQALPRSMTMHLLVMRYGSGDLLLQLTGQSLESAPVTKGHIERLFGPGNPVRDQWLTDTPATDIMERLYGHPHYVTPLYLASRSHIIAEPVPLSGIADLLYALVSHPPRALSVNFEGIGGATMDIGTRETAFPHRAATAIVHYNQVALKETELQPARFALKAATDALAPHATGGVYVNYPEPDLENWAEAYWGENLPRLREVKRKHDPGNLFRHAQSIPL
ncbi:MAG: FAD-binding oxidoreductase [Novosphingobium sp.]|nr:FAD-binding oxidoreductase [Novosphingobium sp.]